MASFDDFIGNVVERVDGFTKQWREQFDSYWSGVPYGKGQASDEEFAMLFEERINGRVQRDPLTMQPVIDQMGIPVYEKPPDPHFVEALLATREGKPIVRGGADLVKRYERIRMGPQPPYGRTSQDIANSRRARGL